MTDEELLGRFAAGTLERLPHADHVRLALLHLARYDRGEALRRLGDGLLHFATLKGHPEKFHVTMTRAWLEIVDAARRAHPGTSAAVVIAACPALLDPRLLDRFYAPGVLDTEAARTSWVAPHTPISIAAIVGSHPPAPSSQV